MAKKTSKTKKADNGNKIVGIIAIIAAAVIVIAIIVAAVAGKNNKIDDGYFVSDDTKYVITLNSEDLGMSADEEDIEYAPTQAHIVYDYEGDTITGMRVYYVYENADDAKVAYDFLTEDATNLEDYENTELNDKYIVLVMPDYSYESMTVDLLKLITANDSAWLDDGGEQLDDDTASNNEDSEK